MMIFSNFKAALLLCVFVVYSFFCLFLVFFLERYSITSALPELIVPDFASIQDTNERKQAFFNFIDPLVIEQNKKIAVQRDELQLLQERFNEKHNLASRYKIRLERLAKEYRLESDELDTKELLENLWLRVDQIPASMVLAQAANESAWGTSRFATDANNYFGQWCFRKGCGIVPEQRAEGKINEVTKYKSARESVASYFRNINTHRAYQAVREIRAKLREENAPVNGETLLQGLLQYSQRGEAYIAELDHMIRINQLAPKDQRINTEVDNTKADQTELTESH